MYNHLWGRAGILLSKGVFTTIRDPGRVRHGTGRHQ
jgi:hypothetical protein